jgi:hypothetical protein
MSPTFTSYFRHPGRIFRSSRFIDCVNVIVPSFDPDKTTLFSFSASRFISVTPYPLYAPQFDICPPKTQGRPGVRPTKPHLFVQNNQALRLPASLALAFSSEPFWSTNHSRLHLPPFENSSRFSWSSYPFRKVTIHFMIGER